MPVLCFKARDHLMGNVNGFTYLHPADTLLPKVRGRLAQHLGARWHGGTEATLGLFFGLAEQDLLTSREDHDCVTSNKWNHRVPFITIG